MKEAEVEIRSLLDPWDKMEIQQLIPDLGRLRRIAEEFEDVGSGGSGREMPDPQIGVVGSAPTARKGADLCGLSKPDAGLASGGRALVGKECNQPPGIQGPVGRLESLNVVVDWRPVVMSDEVEQTLSQRVVGRAGDTDGVGAKDMQNSRQPLPIAVVHGEEKGGVATPSPDILQISQRPQIQVFPTSCQ